MNFEDTAFDLIDLARHGNKVQHIIVVSIRSHDVVVDDLAHRVRRESVWAIPP